jgi:hypothetical protein
MRGSRLTAAFLATTFAASVAMALTPSSADAFCRTRTIPAPADFSGAGGCFTQGLPLYHVSQCVPYQLAAATPSLSRDALSASLARAFGTWTAVNPSCLPGISAIELAPTEDTVIAEYVTGVRKNLVGVVPGPWPHAGGSNTLALTTLTFNATTGEIYDADLELTSEERFATTDTPGMDDFDLTSVLTHEAGHFFGLAHSASPQAVMWPSYMPGSVTQRTLSSDDQLGICAIYPNRTTRVRETDSVAATACDLSPGGPAAPTCGDPELTHGCSTARVTGHDPASTGGSRDYSWLVVLGAVAAAVTWRGRARARS